MTRSISGNMDSRAHVLFLPGSNPLLLFFHHLRYTCRATASDDLVMNTLYEIDARILVLETELTELRARRNTFAPLCQLPVELIIRILKFVQRPADSPDANIFQLSWEPFNPHWCRFTAICHYVRTVALQETELWSFIDLQDYSPKSVSADLWIDLCTERAGVHALVIRAVTANTKINLNARAAKYWLSARAIDVRPRDTAMKPLDKALKLPAPLLQVLSYRGSLRIDSTLLGNGRDSLQSLSVSIGQVVGSQFHALRKLVIESTNLFRSWDPLWDFLRANSQLEVLDLSNIWIQEVNSHEDPYLAELRASQMTRIDMPFLQVVRGCNIPKSTLRLLQALPEPSKELSIDIRDDGHATTWYIDSNNDPTHEHQKLFDIIGKFWKNKTGEPHIRDGAFQSGGDSNRLHHRLKFRCYSGNGTKLSFSTRCVIKVPHPILENITDLILHKVALATWMRESSAEHLSNICQIYTRECAGAPVSWEAFETWLRSRIDEGWPLKLVSFQKADIEATRMVARLWDKDVVGRTVAPSSLTLEYV
jgi:hypothetical protein